MMKDRRDEGLWGWKQRENHNRMIALQQGAAPGAPDGDPVNKPAGGVELAYFGGSAFRITSPAGLSVMIDPWRNPPWGNWDWYLYDFPSVRVDVGVSTHAHFDHDGLHQLSAHTLLDRLIGTYAFADVRITGIADKHVSETSHNAYDWAEKTRQLTDIGTTPPDNWRSFDNVIIVVETGGLRILHWGDNRPNPPDDVWERIGQVDVALLPVDGSWHVLSEAQVEDVAARLGARLIVPHHYGIWDVTTRGSTLLPPDGWVNGRPGSVWAEQAAIILTREDVAGYSGQALCFGEHVAFEKPRLKAPAGA
jgi:L-ascorbate metabolism protein UlaG (beta-lactamase superfamily)